MPLSTKKHRAYLPLFPFAVEQFDLRGYDVVISSSHCVAHGVLTKADQLHICYCHSPIRYCWDMYNEYLEESHLEKGLKSWVVRLLLHPIRQFDAISGNRPDYYPNKPSEGDVMDWMVAYTKIVRQNVKTDDAVAKLTKIMRDNGIAFFVFKG